MRGVAAGVAGFGLQGRLQHPDRIPEARRRCGQPEATMRFETAPGEQAQVDWGSLGYVGADGKKHRMWAYPRGDMWASNSDSTVRPACFRYLIASPRWAVFHQMTMAPSSSPAQDQPSIAHSIGAIPFSVRSCPLPELPDYPGLHHGVQVGVVVGGGSWEQAVSTARSGSSLVKSHIIWECPRARSACTAFIPKGWPPLTCGCSPNE